MVTATWIWVSVPPISWTKTPGRVYDLLSHAPLRHRLDLRTKQRQAILAVPGDVQVDLAVVIVAHAICSVIALFQRARRR